MHLCICGSGVKSSVLECSPLWLLQAEEGNGSEVTPRFAGIQ
jgi:hypothetical protein